ncbi:Gldg family protein [Mucilaginibacter sp. BJC16-A38]|uniref:Gldg family protein n=1 Tax=Mucilaginibacter phenanthrenivorans TaxID=1234842 RepID=UPI0021579EED|nr:Gldg family protein [Mucilaginibacter phenanthrenivorans]MCR8556546.1 Gldg family protein [Mucilaginibacter phenanthrenivorans]
MLKTIKIAQLEISILFYSPVAWLVLVIFMVQSGMGFFNMLQGVQEALLMGSRMGDLTFTAFPGVSGLFAKITETLYLYIPLLSMGLMSRETSSGSIKLLLSSPVKISEIIFGKYLAIVTYGFLLILILAIYSIIGVIAIKDADLTLILSGLIGLFLLTCTYAAIGLFMSSLTSYQVVAAISTLAVFAALRFVGGIGQEINFVRDLTYFLSISGRADDMLKGLITTKDVFYFIIIIVLFISLCILRLQAGREAKPLGVQAGKYVVLVIISLMLGYVSSRPSLIGYLDMTATKSRTLTKNSQEVAKKINGPLTITTYVNLLDQDVYSGLPAARNSDLDMFADYRRFIPGLTMKYVYYYDATDLQNNRNMIYQGNIKGLSIKQVAEKVADNMGLDLDDFMPPAEIRKIIDLSKENNTFVRVLNYKGKTSKLRLYNEIKRFPEEAEITAAIKRLVVTVPKIGFITGNNERSIDKTGDRNYQMIINDRTARQSLINQGFDAENIDLNNQVIPGDITVLVLADPTTALTDAALQKIKNYVDRGGNMLITAEPGRQQILNPLLDYLGVQLMNGMLVAPSKNETPDMVYATIANQAPAIDRIFGRLQQTHSFVAMQGVAAIAFEQQKKFQINMLLESATSGWNKTGKTDLTSTEVTYDAVAGDKKGSFPVAAALSRTINSRQQKIIVSGDADFISNLALKAPKGYNLTYGQSLFKWFCDDAFPVDVSRVATTDDTLQIKRKQLSTFKLVFLGIVPALIVALGAFILISRKRK